MGDPAVDMPQGLNPSAPPFDAVQDTAGDVQHLLLEDLLKDDATSAFASRTDEIFQFSRTHILNALSQSVTFAEMQTIRNELFARLCALFPILKSKRLINRQNTRTLAPDIYIIGYSVVNNLQSQDLAKVLAKANHASSFHNTDESDSDDESVDPKELGEFISVVSQLRKRLAQLEKDFRACREENAALQLRVDELTAWRIQSAPDPNAPVAPRSTEVETGGARVDLDPTDGADDAVTLDTPQLESSAQESTSDDVPDVEATQSLAGRKSKSQRQRTRKKRRAKRRAAENSRTQSQNSELESERVKYYVGGIHPDCTSDDLIRFVRSANLHLSAEHVQTLARNDSLKSVCVDVLASEVNQFVNLHWPRHVYVRPFRGSVAACGGLRGAPRHGQGRRALGWNSNYDSRSFNDGRSEHFIDPRDRYAPRGDRWGPISRDYNDHRDYPSAARQWGSQHPRSSHHWD
jgi:hypothetical protein